VRVVYQSGAWPVHFGNNFLPGFADSCAEACRNDIGSEQGSTRRANGSATPRGDAGFREVSMRSGCAA
jgi:hypothetical protein